jgi:UDP-N-acetylmuramoyl-tripeptide--D-alanyl-D-alanine ligase
LLVVENTRRALIDIAAGYRKSIAMRTIAVTGSAGKTTVKEMTADVLASAAPTARTLGNWNNDIGVPLSLLATERDAQFGVFEVGMNHPGELAPLCEIVRPACGIVTSVGPVHLEFFKDEQGIADEKASVFRALKKSGRAILCRDEKWFDVLRAAAKCRIITTSLRGGADYVAKIVNDGSQRFLVTEKTSGEEIEFIAPLPGGFIVHDALLAIATGRHFGVAWPKIAAAIANYRAAPMRWQREEHGGVAFINDCYNANPLSMNAALDAFAAMKTAGKKYVVLGGMRELGPTERAQHEETGRSASRPEFAHLIVIGERGGWIADGAEKTPAVPVHRISDVDAAANRIAEIVRPGDAVLLKASRGERLERVFEQWKTLQTGVAAT